MILKLKATLFACLAVLLISQAFAPSHSGADRAASDSAAKTTSQKSAPATPGSDLRLASCGRLDAAGWAAPGYWSRTWRGSCGHVSTATYPKIYVAWAVPPFSSGSACVKARGYRWRDGAAYWTSLGCGKSGGGYVHWGQVGHEVMSTTAVKGFSQNIVTGTPFMFTD